MGRSSERLNQCGGAVVLPISAPSPNSFCGDLGAGTCGDALTLSDLLLFSLPLPWKPFVTHSALLVQLENSTGIKAHLPKSVVYAGDNFSCIAPCRQWEPGEAIHLVWNCMLTLCLLLMSSFRFSSAWQPIKIGQKSFVERS